MSISDFSTKDDDIGVHTGRWQEIIRPWQGKPPTATHPEKEKKKACVATLGSSTPGALVWPPGPPPTSTHLDA
jgi:hypothetical protein